MKLKNIFLKLSYLILLPIVLLAQAEMPPAELPEIPKFYFDALSFSSGESGVSRLDIYIEVPYAAIQFNKIGSKFEGSYEVTINIYDSIDAQVNEKWWVEKINVNDYQQTVSRSLSNLNQQSFMLTPGKYFISVQIKDRETGKTSSMKRRVNVRKYFDVPFSISDVMLANRVEHDSGKTIVYPNISGDVGNVRDTFFLVFEAYNDISADSVNFLIKISNVKGDSVQSDSFTQAINSKKEYCFRVVPTSNLIAGDYLLQIHAVPMFVRNIKDTASLSIDVTRTFALRWRGVPISIADLDVAIEQMQYILDRDKIEEMRKANSERKKELFADFWKKKDPTPGTERNELMEEYYSRVAYANKHFGHYMDGWRTDMGMIYIIFGAPSNIERHPFDISSKPYEVWTYYEISREFVFVDVTGFGDYRLQNPIWDLQRTRPR